MGINKNFSALDTPDTPKGVCFLHLFDTSERGVRGVKQGC